MSATTVELPVLDLTEMDFGAVTMLTSDQRWRMVERLLSDAGYTRDNLPTAWAESPLVAWCWLVLVTNGIDFADDDQRPLVHYGIDLGFSSTVVRTFTWALA
jgi:hypothetical protein